MTDNKSLIHCANEDDEWFYDSDHKKKTFDDVIANDHP